MATEYIGRNALTKLCELAKSAISTLEAAIPIKVGQLENDMNYVTTTVTDALGTRIATLEQNSGSSSGSSTGTANTFDIAFSDIILTEGNESTLNRTYNEILTAYNAGYELTVSGDVWLDKAEDGSYGTKIPFKKVPLSGTSQYSEGNETAVISMCFSTVCLNMQENIIANNVFEIGITPNREGDEIRCGFSTVGSGSIL